MYLGWEALEGKLSVTWPSLSSSLAPENKSGPSVPSDRQLIPCNVMTWKPGPIIIPILQMRKRRHRKINYLAFTTHLLSSRAQMQLKELVSRAHPLPLHSLLWREELAVFWASRADSGLIPACVLSPRSALQAVLRSRMHQLVMRHREKRMASHIPADSSTDSPCFFQHISQPLESHISLSWREGVKIITEFLSCGFSMRT